MEAEERNRPLNPYRVPASQTMQTIVDDILGQLGNYENHRGKRKRCRNVKGRLHFRKAVTAIICDLVYEKLTNPQGRVMVPRSKRILGRRTPGRLEIYTEALPDILDALSSPEMAFATQAIGTPPFFRTVIGPGKRLVERIKTQDITLNDLVTEDEVILLKEPKEGYQHKTRCIEYKDTKTIRQYRVEMQEINEWLRKAPIEYSRSTDDRLKGGGNFLPKRLHRIFSGSSFKSGGRLFGGFWENLSKEDRKKYIRIDGEAIAHVDYGQIMPRLLYFEAGATPPQGDIYAIPGFEASRDGLKKVMSAMQFSSKRLRRYPKDARKLFPKKTTIAEVIKAIEDSHPALKGCFFKAKGHRLQFHESHILVRVLLKLKACGITALPVHDCVLVAKSKAKDAEAVMRAVFRDYTGQEIPVSTE